jgi:hypothetical protein
MKLVGFALSFLLSVGLCCKALADEEVQPSQEPSQATEASPSEGAAPSNQTSASSADKSASDGNKSDKSATKKSSQKKKLKLFHKKAKQDKDTTK